MRYPAAVVLACLLTRCEKPAQRPPEEAPALALGVEFDPSQAKPGDRVGELVLDSLEIRRAMDSTAVGMARFSGSLTLTGMPMRHPDSDVRAVCFEADSASARRLPRWAGDLRRPWFCFSNADSAQRVLPSPDEHQRATIVIERFTIYRGLSDEVNAARLISVRTTP
jgi:hypothetical protein